MNRISPFLVLAVLVALCLVTTPGRAGGGPSGFLVVYDQDDPVSVVVANHYQQVRGIPERNMLPVSMPTSLEGGNTWKLIETLRALIAERELAGQIQGIALAGYTPLGARPVQGAGMISLASMLYNAPNCTDPKLFPPVDTNTAFRMPPATPTICLNGYTPVNGKTYWPVSHVGPTDRAALSPRAALSSITAARAADGVKPDGVIYWPLNGDIRSRTREHEIAQVTPLWDKMGIKYSVLDGVWVKNRSDILGGVVGIAVTDVAQNNHYLPGAWVDHLTSFGGVLVDNWQMPCTDFLLAGAAGSAGTMAEPYAIAGKFPHAHIYTHFRNGASLAESFWESIQMLNEILPVGDPLMQPFATFPKVTVTTPKAGTTANGTVKIAVSVVYPVERAAAVAGAQDTILELFIDGRKVKIGDPAETVKATLAKNDFTLDTTSLADGWHEVRVVAYATDAVRTQGETVLPLMVNNRRQTVQLTGPPRVDYTQPNAFMVATGNLANVTGIALRANGRTLATAPGAGAITVPGTAFPFAGTCTVYALATLADGMQISSAPLAVTVEWPGVPATPTPLLAPGVARVRYFADTTTKDFSWDAVPTAESLLTDGQCQGRRLSFTGKSLALPAVPDWATVNYGKRPGFDCVFWFQATRDDVYEFQPSLGELLVDGVKPAREKNGLLGPIPLQAGWHAMRLRGTVSKADFTVSLQVRGGEIGKLTLLPGAWCAAPATPAAPPAPRVAMAKVGAVTSFKAPVSIADTKATLVAEGHADLTYVWTVLSAPRVGVTLHPDEPATVSFAPNGTPGARETTATFTAAGDYVLRVQASNGQTSGYADVSITVPPVATAVTITPARGANAVAGYKTDLYATLQDQFGRAFPAPPAVTWTATPAGVFDVLSAVTSRLHVGPTVGPCQITATVAGKTATLPLTVKANTPPTITSGPQYFPMGNGNLSLNAQATDPDVTSADSLAVQWTLEKKPDGGALTFATPQQRNTTAKIAGAGTYLVKFTATDIGGASSSATLEIKVVVREDGTFAYSPCPRLNDTNTIVTQSANLYASGVYGQATYAWETSDDDGLTWRALPGTQQVLRYESVTEKDANRLFRVRVTNEVGSALSNTAKLVVRDPKGGILVSDQDQVTAKASANTVTLTVHRQRHAAGKAVVEYSIYPNYPSVREKWAKAGVDYTDAKGTLTWADGDAADKTITITLLPRADAPGRGFTVIFNKKEGDIECLRNNTRVWLPSAEEPDGPK